MTSMRTAAWLVPLLVVLALAPAGGADAQNSRDAQRKLDQAQGLVPFAVKLNSELVKKIQARAQERGTPLNEVVAELLEKGLESMAER